LADDGSLFLNIGSKPTDPTQTHAQGAQAIQDTITQQHDRGTGFPDIQQHFHTPRFDTSETQQRERGEWNQTNSHRIKPSRRQSIEVLSEHEPRHGDGENSHPFLSPLHHLKVHQHLIQAEGDLTLQFKRNGLFELARPSKGQREQAVRHRIPWDTGEYGVPAQVVSLAQFLHLLRQRTVRVVLLAKEPEHPAAFQGALNQRCLERMGTQV
jgi:hypothetical protein